MDAILRFFHSNDAEIDRGVKLLRGGVGVRRNVAAAEVIFERLQERDPLALYYLGHCMLAGYDDRPPDPSRAFRFFYLANERGVNVAKYDMAILLMLGDGVANDDVRAVELLRQCRTPASVAFLGACYRLGRGVSPDRDMAIQLWTSAARDGNAYARQWLNAEMQRHV